MSNCNSIDIIDFIIKEGGSPNLTSLGDHIRKNLDEVGIRLNTRVLNATEYASAELDGDYHLVFTNTWGAPYDPHSYMSSWAVPVNVEYGAIGNLQPPLSRENLLARIENVQTKSDQQSIQSEWRSILQDVHEQALLLPLWGAHIPHVINRRLVGYVPSSQAWSLPVHTIQVASGSTTVTVSPGSDDGGLFQSAGPVNPHQYSPNQMWAQDWVYEGLVSYGRDGQILPALATWWTVEDVPSEGTRFTFGLREGVLFHDGTTWNCAAAVLNFDHVFFETVRQRHRWLGAGRYIKSWTCNNDLELVLETNTRFYPLLQELAYIRPLRFASPSAFANGLDSDPVSHNSCESGGFGAGWEYVEEDVICAGLLPIGTGPFKYTKRIADKDGSDAHVIFERNDLYWGQVPGIEKIIILKFKSNEDVETALKDGKLDMALGTGPLTPKQVSNLKFNHSNQFDVGYSNVIRHSLLMFNSNKAPMDDISTRSAVIHAIDKVSFIENDFLGIEQPVMQLFPKSAPYCNIDPSPQWEYNLLKAKLLNCPHPSDIPFGEPSWKLSNQPSSERSPPSLSPRPSRPAGQPISKLMNSLSLEPSSKSSNQPGLVSGLGPSPPALYPQPSGPTGQPASKFLNQSSFEPSSKSSSPPSFMSIFELQPGPTGQPSSNFLNRSSVEPSRESSNQPSFIPNGQAGDESESNFYSSESSIASLHNFCSLLMLYFLCRFAG